MSAHRVVPVSQHKDLPTPYRWRCIHCGERWMWPPEPDDECNTEDAA